MEDFDYQELRKATYDFSPSQIIGKGSHGCIYKALLKERDETVAVKKCSVGLQKLQDNSKADNEVKILTSLPKNQHVLSLLGTSSNSDNNNNNDKLLVMEYMSNGNLHELLHPKENHINPSLPTWPKRVQLAIQLAHAIRFLHNVKPTPVVHRDIKSANVLLDSEWNAKLSDFGLAVTLPPGDGNDCKRVDSSSNNEKASRPAGTIGYLDPGYTIPSKLSTKNDVFSFGVVLLEIISGRKAIEVSSSPTSIVEWAVPLIEEERDLRGICDSRIKLPRYMEDTLKHMLQIARRCISMSEEDRPSMDEIVIEIENCFVHERVSWWYPFWINILSDVINQRKEPQKKTFQKRARLTTSSTGNTTTTIICAAGVVSSGSPRRKMLLKEVLSQDMD